MIIRVWLFLGFFMPFFLFSYSHPSLVLDPNTEKNYFVLTFPRSGTNLFSVYLQSILKNYIQEIGQKGTEKVNNNRLGLDLNLNKKPLYRTHLIQDLRKLDKNQNKLILVVRNYKETMQSRIRINPEGKFSNYQTPEKFVLFFTENHPEVERYLNTLAFFHKWSPENRHLVYYEDLLAKPCEVMKKVLVFLNEPIPEFLTEEYLASVNPQIFSSYQKQHQASGRSVFSGDDSRYYSNKLPKECLQAIDQYLLSRHSDLVREYLVRYLEK